MKAILVLCAVTLLMGGVFVWNAMQMPTEFGSFLPAPKTDPAELVANPKHFLGKPVRVDGVIRRQCKAMGCFFYIDTAKGTLRVDLQEIAMNAPMHEGKPVTVEGQLVPYGESYQLFASAVKFE